MEPRGSILVVDDNIELAENLAEILAGAGYESAVAASAEAARDLIRAGNIAAVLTDFRLPGKNGAELIGELRDAGVDIPVAVMSAYTDPALLERAEEAGAVDVFPKPVDITRLISLIGALGGSSVEVLVVDDNRPLAENFAEALRGCGLSPVVGTSAREALAHRRPMCAALIDFRLPDRSGLHVAARLRARYPAMCILLVSAYWDEGLRADVQRTLPGVHCMAKPVGVETLLGWARELVSAVPALAN
jgi:CheY-like chemotaxis protein